MSDVVPDNQYYDILLTDMSDGSRITYGHIKYSYPDLLRFLKPFAIFVTDNGKQLVFENKSNKNIKNELSSAIEPHINEIEKYQKPKQYRDLLKKIKNELNDDTYKKLKDMDDDKLCDIISKSITYI